MGTIDCKKNYIRQQILTHRGSGGLKKGPIPTPLCVLKNKVRFMKIAVSTEPSTIAERDHAGNLERGAAVEAH